MKGRYAFGFAEAADRITEPMVREEGAWRRVTWEEALRRAAGLLARAVEKHGPESVGVLGSASLPP